MSRARKVANKWFDVSKNSHKATVQQIDLLVSVLDLDMDELLEASPTQGEVIDQLRSALGEERVPQHIIDRRRRNKEARRREPRCRVCNRAGDSTRHHFVNKWILKELSNYREISQRSLCTIPVCIRHHRDLHSRNGGTSKSIVKYLNKAEKQFVDDAIEKLRREHEPLFKLLAKGDDAVYEARLVKDWLAGEFDSMGR